MLKLLLVMLTAIVLTNPALCAEPAEKIRVLVWDEQQPAQKTAYKAFLGNQIAGYLKTLPGLDVKSVSLNDPEQGLSKDSLDNTDVLIWWGHVRHKDVAAERSKDIVERIKTGKLALIALHSAHYAKPFMEAMNARAVQDALAKLSPEERKTAKVETIPYRSGVPKQDTPLSPSSELKRQPDGSLLLEVRLPGCIFPSWRADGMPSHVTTVLADHPIAKGLPANFDISKTEMYSEPFHVPEPDQVVFEERWDKGERFRSGCLWTVGNGNVFYFRPGHETYGVYHESLPLKILENAVRHLGARK